MPEIAVNPTPSPITPPSVPQPLATKQPAQPVASPATIALEIKRDLAVMLVGSDAGKVQRQKPHGSMTKNATAQETILVQEFMNPFLNEEIKRVHEDKTHRAKFHKAHATRPQAIALKGYCLRYAQYLREHLQGQTEEENYYRSKQRLNQTINVIQQINKGLGLTLNDGLNEAEGYGPILTKIRGLLNELHQLKNTNNNNSTNPNQDGEHDSLKKALLQLIQPLETCLNKTAPPNRQATVTPTTLSPQPLARSNEPIPF